MTFRIQKFTLLIVSVFLINFSNSRGTGLKEFSYNIQEHGSRKPKLLTKKLKEKIFSILFLRMLILCSLPQDLRSQFDNFVAFSFDLPRISNENLHLDQWCH